MPATSRGKIYNSLQLGNLFHLFSHKGLWSGSGNYRDNCLSKASRLASDQSVPPEQKTRKAFLCSLNNASELTGCFCNTRKLHVSVSSQDSHSLSLRSLSLSLSRSALHLSMSCPPSRVLVSQLARKHTHAHKQAEKKTSIKSLWNEASAPQHNTKQQERSVWFSSWSGSCSLKVKEADLWPESRWKAVRPPRTGYLTLGHSCRAAVRQVVDDFGYFHSYQVWMCVTV